MYGEDSKSLYYDHETVQSNTQSSWYKYSRVHLALHVLEKQFGTQNIKRAKKKKRKENGSPRGNQERPMDRTRRLQTSLLCGLVWRSKMGFHIKSFRFEGGGRQKKIGMIIRTWRTFKGASFNHLFLHILCFFCMLNL